MENNEMWTLRLQLEDSVKEYTSLKTRIRIGRSPDCDLSFPEIKAISRTHAEIFLRDGMWYITDCGSSNGTWINGKRLAAGEELPLAPGNVIDLAHRQRIVFVDGKEAEKNDTFIPEAASMACPVPAPSLANSAPAAPMPAPIKAAPAPMVTPTASKPKKKGFLSKIGALFEEKSPKADESASVPSAMDEVQFRGTAPETIRPGEYFTVKIMMYREDDYQRADRESAAVADRTKSASSSVFQAAHGQQFRIALQSPDIELDCETQQLRWYGKFSAADFEVYLPENYDRRQLRLRGRVYSDNAVLTDLKLILQVGTVQGQDVVCEKVCLRSAFISYASADRAKVVARLQGIQLARPDMELFFDVESLRRGEQWETRLYREISQRDLFYLFWSQNAASSDWVQKELQYALAQKTADFIEPIPLEGPETCPPPQSLMSKHFNDWTLRYLNNQ